MVSKEVVIKKIAEWSNSLELYVSRGRNDNSTRIFEVGLESDSPVPEDEGEKMTMTMY